MNWYWRVRLGKDDTPLIVLASVSKAHCLEFDDARVVVLLLTVTTGLHLGRRFLKYCQPDITELPGTSLMRTEFGQDIIAEIFELG